MPLWRDQPWRRYGFAVGGAVLAVVLRWIATPLVEGAAPFVTIAAVACIITYVAGRSAGFACATVGGLLSNYFFLARPSGFVFHGPGLWSTIAFVLLTLVLVNLIHMAQMARLESERHAATSRLLFRELQHRVANNIQVVGALLNAQRRRIDDPDARLAIEEAATRLTVIGRISRQLYRPDGAQADLGGFVDGLVAAVLDSAGRPDVEVVVTVPAGLMLEPDRAVPLAIILTESLANALEHGLPDRPGTVHIAIEPVANGRLRLRVEDDGNGLPTDFRLEQATSLGLQIARQLARQIGGSLALEPRNDGPGTRAELLLAA